MENQLVIKVDGDGYVAHLYKHEHLHLAVKVAGNRIVEYVLSRYTYAYFSNLNEVSNAIKEYNQKQLFYIQNDGYCGNALFWWALDSKGYTTDIRKAQKYSFEDAVRKSGRKEDTVWPCNYIDSLEESHKLIIDSQYIDSDLNVKTETHETRSK